MTTEPKPLVVAVDDKAANLQLVGAVLDDAGYAVALVRSGAQLFHFLTQRTPDLILLDVMMPEQDGYEVCELLKRNETVRDIPVIFLTARSEQRDLLRGFEVGGVDYVTKPFEVPELLARVRAHVELRRAQLEIDTLRGILPICARCKSIRNDEGYWERVEAYVSRHTKAQFSHGVCPECFEELYGEEEL